MVGGLPWYQKLHRRMVPLVGAMPPHSFFSYHCFHIGGRRCVMCRGSPQPRAVPPWLAIKCRVVLRVHFRMSMSAQCFPDSIISLGMTLSDGLGDVATFMAFPEAPATGLHRLAHASRLGCGNGKAKNKKPATCSPRSTTGSPKALTRRTCKRRKRCWRS